METRSPREKDIEWKTRCYEEANLVILDSNMSLSFCNHSFLNILINFKLVRCLTMSWDSDW